MTVVWPLRQSAAAYAGVSLAAAVAVHRALVRVAPGAATALRIKWPNDLLLANRKVAGILCEQLSATVRDAAGDQSPEQGVLLIGVGVNVDFDVAQLAGELRHAPTTLREAALADSIPVEAVIEAVAQEIAAAMRAFEVDGLSDALLAELRDRLAYVGTEQTWTSAAGVAVTGRVLGVDAAGRLLLDGPAGLVACDTGELTVSSPADGA